MISGLVRLPFWGFAPPGTFGLPRAIVSWAASHVFGISEPLVVVGSGSGDKRFDWVQVICMLTLALVATAVWSLLDRRRGDYVRLHGWFRLFVRFALGSTMVSYGLSKAIPLQMPAPQLTRLLEPFGNFSPMGVLWYSVGASRPYEIFTGCAELAGGILLFMPRLATLGAIVCVADTIQIFTLNMTYDVPVKLLSFHLLLLSLFVLAPDARRLADVLVLNRTAEPSRDSLWTSRRAARVALVVQLVLGAYLVGVDLSSSITTWTRYGGGAPKPALYGIWTVDEMWVDGILRSPLVNDYGRWRRVVFQTSTAVSFQRMDDSFATYSAILNPDSRTIMLTQSGDKYEAARFTFERPSPERLSLDGTMGGQKIRMQLRLFDRNKFLLVSRGFHWIQEYPFNR
jgi:uncharacterized membrane protein YphA (DoxX/SURF4 family)